MIAKARAIPHGHADLAYIMGESKEKAHSKERIHFVTAHMLDPLHRSREAWDEMSEACRNHPRMTHTVIQVILSPDKEATKDFTIDDWRRLWNDFVETFDTIEVKNDEGEVISKPTNLRNSMHTVWLHFDSKSGTPHLHAAVCRVDRNGHTNHDGNIHIRAHRAADVINLRRGWEIPKDIRAKKLKELKALLYQILKEMQSYSLSSFHSKLRAAGFQVIAKPDSKGVIRGHSIKQGNCHYKMSEIGREFTVSRLEATWRKLHESEQKRQLQPSAPVAKPSAPKSQPAAKPIVKFPDYTEPKQGYVRHGLDYGGRSLTCYLPESVSNLFSNEYDERVYSNAQQMVDICVALFVGYVDAATSIAGGSGGGAGTNDQSPWGRDPKEDEMEWAMRCAREAKRYAHPQPRTKIRR